MDNKKIVATFIATALVFWVFGIVAYYNSGTPADLDQLKAQDISSVSNSLLPATASSQKPEEILRPVSVAGHAQLKKDYITDARGRTLYVTTKGCTLNCLVAWPPYVAGQPVSKENGKLGTMYNEDAKVLQYTWGGTYLYYYAEDKNLGDIKGNGILGVWSIVSE